MSPKVLARERAALEKRYLETLHDTLTTSIEQFRAEVERSPTDVIRGWFNDTAKTMVMQSLGFARNRWGGDHQWEIDNCNARRSSAGDHIAAVCREHVLAFLVDTFRGMSPSAELRRNAKAMYAKAFHEALQRHVCDVAKRDAEAYLSSLKDQLHARQTQTSNESRQDRQEGDQEAVG